MTPTSTGRTATARRATSAARTTPGPAARRRSAMAVPVPDDHIIVLFGATGDLARRKLLPGLFHLA